MYTRKRLKRQGDMQYRSDSEIYIYIFSAIRYRRFPLGIACLARKQYVWLLCASSLTAKCEVACRVEGSTFAPTTATVPRLLTCLGNLGVYGEGRLLRNFCNEHGLLGG